MKNLIRMTAIAALAVAFLPVSTTAEAHSKKDKYDQYDRYDRYDRSSSKYNKRVRMDVQRELRRRGYYRGPIDGDIGYHTSRSIRRYQFDRRLPVSGQIDKYLLRSLRIRY